MIIDKITVHALRDKQNDSVASSIVFYMCEFWGEVSKAWCTNLYVFPYLSASLPCMYVCVCVALQNRSSKSSNFQFCNAVFKQNTIERWTKGFILSFQQKGDLGITKNYRGVTLTFITTKVYNSLLRNCIEPEIEKVLRKNQDGFRRKRSTISQILTIHRIINGVRAKNLEATELFVDFSKASDFIHREKMEQILLANGLSKETVTDIMMLYKNMKVKIRSPDGATDFLLLEFYKEIH